MVYDPTVRPERCGRTLLISRVGSSDDPRLVVTAHDEHLEVLHPDGVERFPG
jgi:hypothetical protein